MMAKALDANGASKVFILGRREEKLQETASLCPNGSAIPVVCDVTNSESLKAAYDKISSQASSIDVLIANSGIMGPLARPPDVPFGATEQVPLEKLTAHLLSVPMSDFTNTLNVNVTGAFYTAVQFLPLLDAANKARPFPSPKPRPQIIFTSSIGGFARTPATSYAYSVSKAAVTALAKSMATTLTGYDIRVNAIAPGLYASEMTTQPYAVNGVHDDGTVEGSFPKGMIPLQRAGGDEDMASALLMLCGKGGGYISGNVVVTDGGRLSTQPSTY